LTEERLGPVGGMDPTELWKQWYETGAKIWTDVLRGGDSYADPYGLYGQWFEGLENVQKRMMQTAQAPSDGAEGSETMGAMDPREVWRKWLDATVESWQKSAQLGTEMMGMTPRWMQMLDQARANMMSVESFPKDPLELAVQWYNATNGPFSEFVQDIIEREEFLEPASRYMHNYASLYKVFRRNSEDYLKSLQIPVRSDISRVAGLIVNLEDKVDRLEEAFEDFEYGYAEPATAETVGALESRVERVEDKIDRVEGKLDQLLATLENMSQNGSAAEPAAVEPEIKATDAARRKARELGVDLAEVRGTGTDGQITISDVRQKGGS
jgi:polyhydroxyalkanoic acid synthase PhaR subunit